MTAPAEPCGRLARAAALAMTALALGCSEDPSRPVVTPPVRRIVSVSVADSLGTPLSGAQVTLVGPDSARTVPVVILETDEEGLAAVTLREGACRVYAREPALGRVAGATFLVPGAASPSADTVLVRLEVHAPSIARGRVTLAGRTDHRGTTVVLFGLPFPAVTTDSTGKYQFDRLPLGRWQLEMHKLGFQVGIAEAVISIPAEAVDVPEVQLISSP